MNATSLWRVLVGATALVACHDSDAFHDYFHYTTLHEAYQASLEAAGLLETALGRDWVAASTAALDQPTPVDIPHRESGYLPPDSAVALGYRFEGRRGEAYVISLEVEGRGEGRVFIDLFRSPADSLDQPRHVASVDSLSPILTGEFHRDGEYFLRLQPELLRGGRYSLTIQIGPSLAFPVQGKDSDAILSGFGAARDGGRREHHGVDIFAPRGTPVLAAASGRITGVREGGLGGKVVWQLDRDRGQYLYYAHLDSQAVVRRQTVRVGDTLGFVGNSGNARTTPPHLHFGIYRRGIGPVDPWPFVHRPDVAVRHVRADTSRLGRWVRTTTTVTLKPQPDDRAGDLVQVERHALMRPQAAVGTWYRVSLPDGAIGYLPAATVELADSPLRLRELAAGEPVYDGPGVAASQVGTTGRDTVAPVLGRYAEFEYVEIDGGPPGWVAGGEPDASAR